MTSKVTHGFKLVRTSLLEEINATLYEFSHIKTGAGLIYLDRDDDNKTFAIGFATPPENDTGVFHIIEHSVLCGSKKYPLNDPFAELLKGSLNTFLNAVTYEDRTVYPVSSRCEKDFMNLVDVYMDAVFAPNMLDNPAIFRQEGWHYEYNAEENSLSYNGVVYNEMKGAYSSPDELGAECLNGALFGDTPYGRDAGGNPSDIPSLSYEQFKETYEKHYHPTNSKIYLDGKMNLDSVLSLIDGHLSRYGMGEAIPLSEPCTKSEAVTREISYEISENEYVKKKAKMLFGYVFADFTDGVSHLTASILCDILCGSNAAPLKRAILERGLANDVTMYSTKSRMQTLIIEVRDADEERLSEIESVINDIISDTVKSGIEKDKITSTLNSIEFKLRERDFGTLPTGIVFAMTIFGNWMYGGLPEDALLLNDTVEAVKARVDSDHFEKSLLSMTLDNPHRAKVIMRPDKALAERCAREEKEKLDALLSSMTEDEICKIQSEEANLRLWQQKEPTDEEINSLPKLSLSDIPEGISRPAADISELDGVKTIRCHITANGIVYLSLFFDASDLAAEELLTLSMLSESLINFPTENHDALSLQNDIKANLGGLYASFYVGERDNKVTPYLKISAKSLISKGDDMLRLIREVLLTSRIDNPDEMAKIITQAKSNYYELITSSGMSLALSRLDASRCEAGAISEYLSGYEAYRMLCEMHDDSNILSEFTDKVDALLNKLVNQDRLTLSVAGDVDQEFLQQVISILPKRGETVTKKTTALCADKSEFFLTPSKVAYAVLGGRCDEVGKNLGIMRVARSILSYEYLWNTVRVQSGAYGTGFVPRKDGCLSFYSYRDPSPKRSLEFYRGSADYLRSLAEGDSDITKFIIGAIGEYDTLITPRTAALISENDCLNGWTLDDEVKVRSDMLNTSAKDLLTVADIIDRVTLDERVIIVGGAEHLESLPNKPEKIIVI